MTQVVFTVLDGLPVRHVRPEVTPHLCALAAEAGQRPATAQGVMPAATYPNHATFVTGVHPRKHGVVANWFFADGQPVPAESVGPEGRTLFAACREAGRSSALVVGDQHLVGVMGGDQTDEHWPAAGRPPEGTLLDRMGYVGDDETITRLGTVLTDGHDLVVAQVNGPDTIGHLLGPDSPDALDAYHGVDGLIPTLRDALARDWDDTVLIVVTDHDMEPLSHPDPIDAFALATQHGCQGLPEGGAALFETAEEPAWLAGVAGCAGYEEIAPRLFMAWTEPGWWFAVEGLDLEYRGMHGNPTTLEQLAIVTGGHAAAAPLAQKVAAGSVTALDWAPTIAGLLDLDLPDAAGRDLLASP